MTLAEDAAAIKTRRRDQPGGILSLGPIPGRRRLPTILDYTHLDPGVGDKTFARGIFLSGFEFRRLTNPLVYAWMRSGGDWLYVGVCKRGLRRLTMKHESVKDIDPRKDWFFFWPCPTYEAALRLERRLIRKWRPALNKVWNPAHPQYANGFRGSLPKKRNERRVPEFRSAYWAPRPKASSPTEGRQP